MDTNNSMEVQSGCVWKSKVQGGADIIRPDMLKGLFVRCVLLVVTVVELHDSDVCKDTILRLAVSDPVEKYSVVSLGIEWGAGLCDDPCDRSHDVVVHEVNCCRYDSVGNLD